MFEQFFLFSGTLTKRVPKSIKECREPNLVTETLWSWAQIVERIGAIAFLIWLVCGIISAFVVFFSTDMDVFAFLGVELAAVISALAEFLAFRAVAVVIAALANITFNTSVSANVALYEHLEDEKAEEAAENAKKEERRKATVAAYSNPEKKEDATWICSACGKTNYNFNKAWWACRAEKPE